MNNLKKRLQIKVTTMRNKIEFAELAKLINQQKLERHTEL